LNACKKKKSSAKSKINRVTATLITRPKNVITMSPPALPPSPRLFDYQALDRNAKRARLHEGYDFILRTSAQRLDERFAEIKRDFKSILDLGGFYAAYGAQNCHVMPFPFTPLNDDLGLPAAHYDAIICNLSLQTMNDLPGGLIQIKRALKPDGVFIGVFLGLQTLQDVRQTLITAEEAVRSGVTPRIAPFIDRYDMASLMQRAGFALPVVDADLLKISYDHLFKIFRDLRYMGAGNPLTHRVKHFTGKGLFAKAAELFHKNHQGADGRCEALVELLFTIGWAPDASQPQPLKRGSATASLSDIIPVKKSD
jgi:SAM-dependent methyltransferase